MFHHTPLHYGGHAAGIGGNVPAQSSGVINPYAQPSPYGQPSPHAQPTPQGYAQPSPQGQSYTQMNGVSFPNTSQFQQQVRHAQVSPHQSHHLHQPAQLQQPQLQQLFSPYNLVSGNQQELGMPQGGTQTAGLQPNSPLVTTAYSTAKRNYGRQMQQQVYQQAIQQQVQSGIHQQQSSQQQGIHHGMMQSEPPMSVPVSIPVHYYPNTGSSGGGASAVFQGVGGVVGGFASAAFQGGKYQDHAVSIPTAMNSKDPPSAMHNKNAKAKYSPKRKQGLAKQGTSSALGQGQGQQQTGDAQAQQTGVKLPHPPETGVGRLEQQSQSPAPLVRPSGVRPSLLTGSLNLLQDSPITSPQLQQNINELVAAGANPPMEDPPPPRPPRAFELGTYSSMRKARVRSGSPQTGTRFHVDSFNKSARSNNSFNKNGLVNPPFIPSGSTAKLLKTRVGDAKKDDNETIYNIHRKVDGRKFAIAALNSTTDEDMSKYQALHQALDVADYYSTLHNKHFHKHDPARKERKCHYQHPPPHEYPESPQILISPRKQQLYTDLYEDYKRRRFNLEQSMLAEREREDRELKELREFLQKNRMRNNQRNTPRTRPGSNSARGRRPSHDMLDGKTFLEREAAYTLQKEMNIREKLRLKEVKELEKWRELCTFKPDTTKPSLHQIRNGQVSGIAESPMARRMRRKTETLKMLAGKEEKIQVELTVINDDYSAAVKALEKEFDKVKVEIEKDETERVLDFLQREEGHRYLREKVQAVLRGTAGATNPSSREQVHAQQVIVADLVHKSTKRVWVRVNAEMDVKRSALSKEFDMKRFDYEQDLAKIAKERELLENVAVPGGGGGSPREDSPKAGAASSLQRSPMGSPKSGSQGNSPKGGSPGPGDSSGLDALIHAQTEFIEQIRPGNLTAPSKSPGMTNRSDGSPVPTGKSPAVTNRKQNQSGQIQSQSMRSPATAQTRSYPANPNAVTGFPQSNRPQTASAAAIIPGQTADAPAIPNTAGANEANTIGRPNTNGNSGIDVIGSIGLGGPGRNPIPISRLESGGVDIAVLNTMPQRHPVSPPDQFPPKASGMNNGPTLPGDLAGGAGLQPRNQAQNQNQNQAQIGRASNGPNPPGNGPNQTLTRQNNPRTGNQNPLTLQSQGSMGLGGGSGAPAGVNAAATGVNAAGAGADLLSQTTRDPLMGSVMLRPSIGLPGTSLGMGAGSASLGMRSSFAAPTAGFQQPALMSSQDLGQESQGLRQAQSSEPVAQSQQQTPRESEQQQAASENKGFFGRMFGW